MTTGQVRVGLLAVLGAAAAPAFAQIIEPLPSGIRLGARIESTYDPNFLRLTDGQAPPPGTSKTELFTTVSAVARGEIKPGQQRLYVDAEVGQSKFDRNSFLASRSVQSSGGWDWRLGTRCSGTANAAWSEGQADFADQGLIAKNRRDVVSYGAGGGCRVGLALLPVLSVRHREISNSNPERHASNSQTDTVNFTLSYNRTGAASVSLGVRDEQYDYTRRFGRDGLPGVQVTRRAVGGRFSRHFGAGPSFSLFADYNWVRTELVSKRQGEISGGASASYRPASRWGLSTTFEREIDASFFVAAGYVRRDRAELNLNYRLGHRTGFVLRGTEIRNKYQDLQAVPGADTRRFDRTRFASGTLTYRLLRGVDLTAETRYTQRSTDAVFGEFRGLRYNAAVRATF